MAASPFACTEDQVNEELIRLRDIEEAAYKRLRQQDSVVKALKKELEVAATPSHHHSIFTRSLAMALALHNRIVSLPC